MSIVVLILLVIAIAAIAVAGRHPRVVPPFGVAANGLIAIEVGGDIVVSDPSTGARRVLIGGPDDDRRPMFSRDGSRVAFLRGSVPDLRLVVASADGTGQVVLDAGPIAGNEVFDWSPTGASILMSVLDPGDRPPVAHGTTVRVVPTDGSSHTSLDLGMAATSALWRPPAGHDLLFLGAGTDTATHGIYLASADGRRVTPIVARTAAVEIGYPEWDPSGQTIAFTEWDTAATVFTARQRVVDVPTGQVRTLPLDESATWGVGSWSNDGSRLVVTGFAKAGVQETFFAAIVEVRGRAGTVVLQPPSSGQTLFGAAWSPDDQVVVGTPLTLAGEPLPQQLWDARTGTARAAPWAATASEWQRAAPRE